MKIKETNYQKYKREQLNNPEFKRLYEEEKLQAKIAMSITKEREAQHINQREMARRAAMKQPAIARLENAEYNCTIKTLQRVAAALGKKVSIKFI